MKIKAHSVRLKLIAWQIMEAQRQSRYARPVLTSVAWGGTESAPDAGVSSNGISARYVTMNGHSELPHASYCTSDACRLPLICIVPLLHFKEIMVCTQ